MSVKLTLSYETLVALIEQLPRAEIEDLLHHLQERLQEASHDDDDKWEQLFLNTVLDWPVSDTFSFNRADWYDDDIL